MDLEMSLSRSKGSEGGSCRVDVEGHVPEEVAMSETVGTIVARVGENELVEREESGNG